MIHLIDHSHPTLVLNKLSPLVHTFNFVLQNTHAEHTPQSLIKLCQASSYAAGAGDVLLDVLSTLTVTGGGRSGASSLLLLGPPGVGNARTQLLRNKCLCCCMKVLFNFAFLQVLSDK